MTTPTRGMNVGENLASLTDLRGGCRWFVFLWQFIYFIKSWSKTKKTAASINKYDPGPVPAVHSWGWHPFWCCLSPVMSFHLEFPWQQLLNAATVGPPCTVRVAVDHPKLIGTSSLEPTNSNLKAPGHFYPVFTHNLLMYWLIRLVIFFK